MEVYFQGSEVLILQQNGWDGTTCFIVKTTLSDKKYYITTGLIQYVMKTSKRQISLFTEEQLTCLPGDSLASHIVWQGFEKGKMMNAISGQKCLEQFERLSRPGSWAKTFSGLLVGMEGWSSKRCRLIWKLKGTKYNRMYFQLRVLKLRTKEIESGLLPTPVASEGERGSERMLSIVDGVPMNISPKGVKFGIGIRQLAEQGFLPSPVASDATMGAIIGNNDQFKQTKGLPRKINQNGNDGSVGLARLVQLLPTPTATSDAKGGCTRTDPKRQKDTLAHAIHGQVGTPGKTSQLNPRFVMEMMGFPGDWTELPFLNGETNQSKQVGMQ